MEQNKRAATDWSMAVEIGLDKDYLHRNGYMDVLIAGEKTPPLNMKLSTGSHTI